MAAPELQALYASMPDRLAQARRCYRRARQLLGAARCPRCRVDLELRDANLALAAGDLRGATRRFVAAASS